MRILFITLCMVSCINIQGDTYKPRLYTLYTPSHKILFDRWFKPSFTAHNKDEFELVVTCGKQKCASKKFNDTKL